MLCEIINKEMLLKVCPHCILNVHSICIDRVHSVCAPMHTGSDSPQEMDQFEARNEGIDVSMC